ncbi:reprolysin-like metallopeptidase [Tenacibaculum soleae]|uniref:reprolysin-like metallopeptidase n=1 Tax=Tenacibaculum soleae TaxID=447689 RepID=UPI0023015F26|nr:zinc-dependent metalloprotease family protein [Tenacibaculum soleae]
MIKKNVLLVVLFFIFITNSSFSQSYWNKRSKKDISIHKKEILSRKNIPQKYSLAILNLNKFKKHLTSFQSKNNKKIITLPNSKGELIQFYIQETSYLAPKLAAKFPMIKSYSAQEINNPTTTAKISLGVNGFHALINYGNKGTLYIDPYTKNKEQYIIYKKKDLIASNNDFACKIEETAKSNIVSSRQQRNANDGRLRTFRTAIACTGEYSQFHINRANPTPTTDTEKKAVVLSAINTTMARVNEVYERDLGVRMILVSNNDDLIFLDATTDGLTNDDSDDLIDESQQKCDAIIGDANYDIGHTFSTGGGGLASVRSVCVTNHKASGITGRNQPINDPYDIDYVAHEIGHQFGAMHTQNNDCNRNNATAVEPGSGSTIMGYAGICDPDVQGNSHANFHAISIAQMWTHIQNSGNCATLSNTNNDAPVANAGANYSIPKSTPFILKGTATDTQGTSGLTYNWEQTDNEIATMPPVSTNTAGPTFRALPSSTSPNRYLPTLANVVNGTSNQWEVLPSVERELNFAFTVRDNHIGGGNSDRDDVTITVTNAIPFTITAPNTNVIWNAGDTQTITWNKGTTDIAPINCSKVTIKLSTDGGVTFPIILKENTDNDGTESIIVPNNATTQARILVEAADNIFYNVNTSKFTINANLPTFFVTNNTSKQTVCNNSNNTVEYSLDFDFVNGFNETVTLSATGLPNGATANFTPSTINADGNVMMTVDNLNGTTQQEYTIVVQARTNTFTKTTEALLKVISNNFSTQNLTSPANANVNTSITPTFEWETNLNATSYKIEIATNANFSSIIINETTTVNSYTPSSFLSHSTNYYWRVKPINACEEGVFSNNFTFTTEDPSYCDSTFTDETGGTEHITNVTFNTINNTSGNNTVNGYENFTTITTNLERKKAYEISITLNTGGFQDHCYVFIDWNQDYQFNNSTERYDLGNQTADIATTVLNITVPEDAVLGKTRMRVLIEYFELGTSSNGDGACDSDHKSEWGETEDYTINIEDNLATNNNLFTDLKIGSIPLLSNQKLNIEFKVKSRDLIIIRLFDLAGNLVHTQNFSTISNIFKEKVQFPKMSSGIYLLQLENSGKTKTRKIIIE